MIKLFFFNDTATTEIYTLSLHDALPILPRLLCLLALFVLAIPSEALLQARQVPALEKAAPRTLREFANGFQDRKSTRLNSSHQIISYAVFCLKKKTSQTAIHEQCAPATP